MKYDIDDLRFVFVTNSTNSHLAELSVHQLLKYANRSDVKVSVISNQFESNTFLHQDKINYINANIPYEPYGNHFADMMLKVLPTFEEKYVFFFCDDYMMTADIKWNDLHSIMKLIRSEDIDYFGFDDAMNAEVETFPMYEKEHEGIPSGVLRWRGHDYRYICSVQPAIWKKDVLFSIIETHRPNLHGLDDTWPSVRESAVKLRMLYHTLHSCFTDTELWYEPPHDRPEITHYDYFGIAYVETVRHGVFMVPENGWGIPTQRRTKLLEQIIAEFDLLNNPKFFRLLEHRKKKYEN